MRRQSLAVDKGFSVAPALATQDNSRGGGGVAARQCCKPRALEYIIETLGRVLTGCRDGGGRQAHPLACTGVNSVEGNFTDTPYY